MSDSSYFGNLPREERKLFCHQELNRCVADPFFQVTQKLAGHTCINNYECRSGECVPDLNDPEGRTYCRGTPVNGACSDDADCEIGTYCDQDTCQSQKAAKTPCSRDAECKNNLACANGHCIRYGGIFNGQKGDNALACQGGRSDWIHQMGD